MSTRKPKPTEQQQHDNAEAAPDDDMRDRSAEESSPERIAEVAASYTDPERFEQYRAEHPDRAAEEARGYDTRDVVTDLTDLDLPAGTYQGTPGDNAPTGEGVVLKGRRTVNGVTGIVFGPAGRDFPFREPEPQTEEELAGYVASILADLPTEEGVYVDSIDAVWRLGDDGLWACLDGDSAEMEQRLPFRRLVPQPVLDLEAEATELAAREQRVVDILLDLVRVGNGEQVPTTAVTFSDFAALVIKAVEG